MIKKYLFIFFLMSIQGTTYGAEAKKIAAVPMNLSVNYGDKTTKYEIIKTTAGGKITLSNNEGLLSTKEISLKNYNYLISRAKKVKDTNKKEFCQRNYIELSAGSKKSLGCIGSGSSTARDLTQLSNLLGVVF